MQTSDLLERRYPGRRAELKRSILGNALSCFNEHGIEATTIEHIRTVCDTSVGAIYHHFGNKEGLVAALFFAALDDQSELNERYLSEASNTQQVVYALVHTYVDWVTNQPEWARFLFYARFAVTKGPFKDELIARNKLRSQSLRTGIFAKERREQLKQLPSELIPALIIGQAESYCRAWLSGRVKATPASYRAVLAEAAWHAIAAEQPSL